VSDNEVICDILNSYFGSVFTSENVNNDFAGSEKHVCKR